MPLLLPIFFSNIFSFTSLSYNFWVLNVAGVAVQGRISFSFCIAVQCNCTVQPCHSLPGSNRLFHLLLEVPHSFFLKKKKKADNFVKYTDIEIYHTTTFFCTFATIFAPIFLWFCLFKKLKNWSIACYRVLLA